MLVEDAEFDNSSDTEFDNSSDDEFVDDIDNNSRNCNCIAFTIMICTVVSIWIFVISILVTCSIGNINIDSGTKILNTI